ncbi:protein D3 [Drosophila montana]|uniref:protein D3 n=1 Tax=Drosophila montana TaxID=40370 RepID=UPI00313DCB41
MWTNCSRLLCLYLSLSLCLCPGQCLSVSGSPQETIVSKFLRHLDVIPDLIDVGPQDFLNVTYAGNIRADRGVELQPLQVRDEPTVHWIAGKDDYYTLLMTDPDVPEKMYPQLKEYLHWLVVNIPGDHKSLGDVRVGYVGATPAKGSGLHRYVFLLYKQPDYLKFDFDHVPKHSDRSRIKFSTREFVQKYNLGFPLAGNFFTSEWSKEVPDLHKALHPKGETLSF